MSNKHKFRVLEGYYVYDLDQKLEKGKVDYDSRAHTSASKHASNVIIVPIQPYN